MAVNDPVSNVKGADTLAYVIIGVVLLILAGIIYGIYQLFASTKKFSLFTNVENITKGIRSRLIKDKPFTVVYYSYKNCPFCMEFNPEWEKFVRKVQNIKGIKTEKIDSTENPERIIQDDIESFPTIKINDVIYDFNGEPRSAELLYNEVMQQYSKIDSNL